MSSEVGETTNVICTLASVLSLRIPKTTLKKSYEDSLVRNARQDKIEYRSETAMQSVLRVQIEFEYFLLRQADYMCLVSQKNGGNTSIRSSQQK